MYDQREYQNQYFREHLCRLSVNVPKESRTKLHAWCKEHDTTIQGLTKKLLTETTGISFNQKDYE